MGLRLRFFCAIACLLAGMAITGCGGSSSHSAAASAGASSFTSATISHGPATAKSGGTHTSSGTTSSTSHSRGRPPRPGTSSRRPVAPGGRNHGPVSTYSGPGNTTIASLNLQRDAVLHWAVAGGQFSLHDRSGKLHVAGKGPNGQSFAPAGSFHAVTVSAGGRWTLKIELLAAP